MRTVRYSYDGLQRLTGAAESPGTTYGYTYDLAGDRTGVSLNGVTAATYAYDAADQVQGWTYDAAGNLTGDGTTTYSYDALNELTGTSAISATRTYSYNGDGTLVSQVAGGTTTRYAQDLAAGQAQVLAAISGSSTTDFLYGNGAERLAAVSAGLRTWYGADAQGSVRQTLDDNANVLAYQNYDPYGQPETSSRPSAYFGYTGELQDTATGYVNLRARWYQPGYATLLGVDPALDQTGQPYAYVYGNPVNWADPSGLFLGICDTGLSDCTQAAVNALASTPWGRAVLRTISGFDNTDFAGAVYGDVSATLQAAQGVYEGAAFCVRDPSGCKNAAGALALYISQHPSNVAAILAKDGTRQFTDITQELCAGQYGAVAGHLLVDFATLKGASLFRSLFKAAQDLAIFSKLASEAAQAVPRGSRSAQVWGTLVHSEFERRINALGRSDIRTEVRFLHGVEQTGKRVKGEVRLDVAVYDKNGNIVQIYDLKTGAEGLTAARIAQLQSHLPFGSHTAPVTEIRP